MAPEAFVEKINERWHHYVSFLEIAAVALFALLLKVVYGRSRRSLVEHFIFSLHLFSFFVLLAVLRWPLILLIGVDLSTSRLLLLAVIFLILLVYIFLAVRRVYGDPRGVAGVKAGILTAGLFFIFGGMMGTALILAYFGLQGHG